MRKVMHGFVPSWSYLLRMLVRSFLPKGRR